MLAWRENLAGYAGRAETRTITSASVRGGGHHVAGQANAAMVAREERRSMSSVVRVRSATAGIFGSARHESLHRRQRAASERSAKFRRELTRGETQAAAGIFPAAARSRHHAADATLAYLSAARRAFLSHASAASHAFFRPPCEASPKYALALGRDPPSVIL